MLIVLGVQKGVTREDEKVVFWRIRREWERKIMISDRTEEEIAT